MPRISAFYGITIWMYWDEGVHPRRISTRGTAGTTRRSTSTARLSSAGCRHGRWASVSEWALLHPDELQANWDRARESQPLLTIEPLA